MKRTGFKPRKTPLRNKGKSASKQAQSKPLSWYRKKVIEAFMAQFRGKPCAVCGTTYRTCGHHILAKGSHPAHIITPENIVVLCMTHHRFSNDMAPHSTNQLAVHRFCEWMKEHLTWQYNWCVEHEWDKIKHDWKELWLTMTKEVGGE